MGGCGLPRPTAAFTYQLRARGHPPPRPPPAAPGPPAVPGDPHRLGAGVAGVGAAIRTSGMKPPAGASPPGPRATRSSGPHLASAHASTPNAPAGTRTTSIPRTDIAHRASTGQDQPGRGVRTGSSGPEKPLAQGRTRRGPAACLAHPLRPQDALRLACSMALEQARAWQRPGVGPIEPRPSATPLLGFVRGLSPWWSSTRAVGQPGRGPWGRHQAHTGPPPVPDGVPAWASRWGAGQGPCSTSRYPRPGGDRLAERGATSGILVAPDTRHALLRLGPAGDILPGTMGSPSMGSG